MHRAANLPSGIEVPFAANDQLVDFGDGDNLEGPGRGSLPGHPLVPLNKGDKLGTFLEAELCCDDLETMAPYLWMMSTQSSASIRPLHCHRLLGRQILITESPRLHLVWYYDRVFVKPLPRYILSHSFWETYLLQNGSAEKKLEDGCRISPTTPWSRTPGGLLGDVHGRAEKIRRAALGYIRTYRFLIQHESDLSIALSLGLIPPGTTWTRFCAFVSNFDDLIRDDDVSGRYHYGDLRLTRLNFYCVFLLRRPRYEYLPEQYSVYFSRYFGPLIFIFAAVSVMLSAMQLEMAVQDESGVALFDGARIVYRWFSLVVVILALVIGVYLVLKMIYQIVDEWVFALKARRRIRGERSAMESLETGSGQRRR